MSFSMEALLGDITRLEVDAIVNAANTRLLGGGGVDGAIHRAAGPELLEACRALKGCPTGESRITPGFRLPARYVIHTAGPVWGGGKRGEDDLLAGCYRSAMLLAREQELHSMAFPCISTGVYRFPADRAAGIAFRTVKAFEEDPGSLKRILFCCFNEDDFLRYRHLLEAGSGERANR